MFEPHQPRRKIRAFSLFLPVCGLKSNKSLLFKNFIRCGPAAFDYYCPAVAVCPKPGLGADMTRSTGLSVLARLGRAAGQRLRWPEAGHGDVSWCECRGPIRVVLVRAKWAWERAESGVGSRTRSRASGSKPAR